MRSYSQNSEFLKSKLKLILALKIPVSLLPKVRVRHFLYITAFHTEMSAIVMLF